MVLGLELRDTFKIKVSSVGILIRRNLAFSYHKKSAYFWFDDSGPTSFCDFPYQILIVYIRQMERVQDRCDIDLPKLYRLVLLGALDTFREHLVSTLRHPDRRWCR